MGSTETRCERAGSGAHGGRARARATPACASGHVAVALIGLLVGGVLAHAVEASGPRSPAPVPELRGWTSLHYAATKFLVFSGDIVLTREATPDRRAIRAESRAKLFGAPFVESWSLSALDRDTGLPSEFVSVRPGKRSETWRLRGGELERTVRKPDPETPPGPIDSWRVTSSGRFPNPGGVHDYISMIVRLGEMNLAKIGDEARVQIMTSRGAVPVRVVVSEARPERRTVRDLGTGRKRTWTSTALRLRLAPEGDPASARGFLDMEGETELWMDPGSGVLLEITGRIPKVPGRVVISLDAYR